MRAKKSSNRSFGYLFSIVFILIALWPILNDDKIRIWAIILAIIFFTLGLLKSKLLTPFNDGWIKLGELLGRIIAPIVMFVIYILIVTPTGLLLRIAGKDLLKLKFDKKIKSYWENRKETKSMKRQF